MKEVCVYLTATNGSLVYSDLVSTIALIFSICSFIFSQVISAHRMKREKAISDARYEEQRKQYEERLQEERKRREEDKSEYDEKRRISEEPYLVLTKSTIDRSDGIGSPEMTIIRIEFTNKGRGTAYEINPKIKAYAKTKNGEGIIMRRQHVINDPVVMVGESFVVRWGYIYERVGLSNMTLMVKFRDASGRIYKQTYYMGGISEHGKAISISHKHPELVGEDCDCNATDMRPIT